MPNGLAGLPMGIMDGQSYEAHRLLLGPGDCVLFFSDGVTDAMNLRNEGFLAKGIHAALTSEGPRNPRALGERIIKAVRLHASGRAQNDDITLVCVGRAG
jgi:sigma-B regulation protein RsbU (phosphoserine phosphatase)